MLPLEWSASKAFTIFFLILIAAFASSSETAFFSLNRFQLRRIKDKNKVAFRRIKELLAKPSKLLVLILLINEMVNITISSMITEFVHSNRKYIIGYFGETSFTENQEWFITTLIALCISIPLLLIFADITPKIIASKANKFLAMNNSKPLYFLSKIFSPILNFIDYLINGTLKFLKIEGKDHFTKTMSALSEEEFILLMEEGHREGTVNRDELELISNVLEFDDTHVHEVMVPMERVYLLPEEVTLYSALDQIKQQKYTRIPVYRGNTKKIVGMINVKNLLLDQNLLKTNDKPIKDSVSSVLYVGPNTSLSVLFKKMKSEKIHLAVIQNNKNESIGITTLEDVLESIFGAIEDERDVK